MGRYEATREKRSPREIRNMTIEELEKQMDDLRVEYQRERSAADEHTFKMNQIGSKIHKLNDMYEKLTGVDDDEDELELNKDEWHRNEWLDD